jgi:AcrR family transcriptional regulator
MFLEQGFAGVSMSSIVKAVGGSKGTLYQYFESKTELLSALMRDVWQDVGELPRWRDVAIQPGHDWLHDWARHYLLHLHDDRVLALYGLVVAEAGRFPAVSQEFYSNSVLEGRAALAEGIDGVMVSGLLRRRDPEAAAEVLRALVKAGSL